MSAASPPAVPEWTMADRLRKARESAGFSQAGLAAATGISRQSISRYESGHAVPRRPELLAWSMACHVEYGWLAGAGPAHRGGRLVRHRAVALAPLLMLAADVVPQLLS